MEKRKAWDAELSPDVRAWLARCSRLPVIVRHAECVTVTAEGVREFARRWPCFGDVRPVAFGFDARNGDLVDLSGDRGMDGSGVCALSHDAFEVAQAWLARGDRWARRGDYFDARGNLRRRLPQACLRECSASGPCDAAVREWRVRLAFAVPRALAVAWLREFGAWEVAELEAMPEAELAERALWLLAGESRDNRGARSRFPQPYGVAR